MDLTTAQRLAATRISYLRTERRIRQEDLARHMGFESRQTLSDIEQLKRPISGPELAAAAQVLRMPVAAIMDPFQLLGEGQFNFRTTQVEEQDLVRFQEDAGRWAAIFRVLKEKGAPGASLLAMHLNLSERSAYEDVAAAAESLSERLGLGTTPAQRLEKALGEKLGIEVLYVDAPDGISGAAVHLPDLQMILVNRHESRGRRSFDIAHELFHVLTWHSMTPARVEPVVIGRQKGNRVEQLAENFAAALLMPRELVESRWAVRGDESLTEWIPRTAEEMWVSASALGWRLVNLGLLGAPECKRSINGPPSAERQPTANGIPTLFSARFITTVHSAVESGHMSVRRAASLLQLSLTDFANLCESYERSLSYDFAGHA